MKKPDLSGWLQHVVSLSVLAGVLLVAWEVSQNNKLAAYERVAEVNQMWMEIYQYETQENIWILYQKSIEAPDELTDSELVTLDNWLSWVMDIIVLNVMQNREHGLQNAPLQQAGDYANHYFVSQFSRNWLIDNRHWFMDAPEMAEAIIKHFDESPPATEFSRVECLRSYAGPTISSEC